MTRHAQTIGSPEARQRKVGLMIVATGVTAISFDALLIRLADTQTWNVIFWRGLFTCLSLALILVLRKKAPFAVFGRRKRLAWISAFLFGTGEVFFVSSIMFTSVANTVVIISSAPLFAALLTRIFRIETIPLRTWLAIGMALCGVSVVFAGSLGQGGMLGVSIAVVTAFNEGGNLTILRRYPDLERMPLICLAGLIMACIAWPMAEPFSVSGQGLFFLAVMGLVQTPLALILIAESTLYLPSPEVGLFYVVETVMSPIWVWCVLGEVPPSLTFLGGGMIVTTLAVHYWLGMREFRKMRQVAWGRKT